MATVAGRVVIDLMAKTGQFSSGLRTAQGDVRRFSSGVTRDFQRVQASQRTLTTGGGGFVAGFGKLGVAALGAALTMKTLSAAADAALTQRKAESKLAQVLKSTGNAAGVAADDVKKFASERQKLTDFGDEATIDAAGVLASFTNISGKQFYAALEAAQDLSAFLDKDLRSLVLQVGKALNDPIRGISALSDSGVQFSQSQRKLITDLTNAGKIVEAQKIILGEFTKQFGKQAEVLSSEMKRLKGVWGDLMEEFGAPVDAGAGALTPLVETLIDLTKALKEASREFKGVLKPKGGVGFDMPDLGVGDWFRKRIEDITGRKVAWRGQVPPDGKDNPAFKAGFEVLRVFGGAADAVKKQAMTIEKMANKPVDVMLADDLKEKLPDFNKPPAKQLPGGVGAVGVDSVEGYNNLQRAIQGSEQKKAQVLQQQKQALDNAVGELRQIRRLLDNPSTEIEFA